VAPYFYIKKNNKIEGKLLIESILLYPPVKKKKQDGTRGKTLPAQTVSDHPEVAEPVKAVSLSLSME
jgi:hypothetical protein